MALLMKFATRFGVTFDTAYHKIAKLTAYREQRVDEKGGVTEPVVVELTIAVFVSKDARDQLALPIDQVFVKTDLAPTIDEGPMVAQAYQLLKTVPEYQNATDA